MQTEPPKAESPKRNRRRFQFSLRTLFVVITIVAVVCGYVGWQVKIVRERERLLGIPEYHVVYRKDERAAIPIYRRWLGDQGYGLIGLADDASDETLEMYRSEFPEGVVVRVGQLGAGELELARRYGELHFEPGAQ